MNKQKAGWFGLKKWFKSAAPEKSDTLMESLQKYTRDPSYRDQFCKDLCESDVYVINYSDSPPQRDPGTGLLTQAYSFKTPFIEYNGKQWVAIFSALPLLGAYAKIEVKWVALNALEFFGLMQGANVLLNPGAPYGAVLGKEEIQEIRKTYHQRFSA